MRPSVRLIEALRKSAARIEAPDNGYCWATSGQCNCGFLAAALGCMEEDFEHCGTWSKNTEAVVCGATGMSVYNVIRQMLAAGLSQQDISDIENLTNLDVRDRAGLVSIRASDPGYPDFFCDRNNAKCVARYFRAQADLLEEQLRQQNLQPSKPACAHLPMFGLCVYCGHVEAVATPVKEVAV